jgi:hypothetical protein
VINKFLFRKIQPVLVLLILLVLASPLVAQQKSIPLLERSININVSNETIESALKKIGKSAGFSFSYKSSLIQEKEVVSFQGANRTVREILDQLFKGEISYKERGSHLILIKAEKQSSKDSKMLNGYVIDEATGARLKNVSVYDPVSLSSAVTDSYGYFQIEIKNPTDDEIKLAINKNTYIDTVVVVGSSWKRIITIPIKENARKIGSIADSVGNKMKRVWLNIKRSSEQAANIDNISDTLYRKHQFGVFPFVGTNGNLSGNVINDYSFNLLGGYSLGNRKFELGGIFNINRTDVYGAQIAGTANAVGGKQEGWQFAGLANVVVDSSNGIQMAGLINANFAAKKTAGVAGLVNFNYGNTSGVGLAGLVNFALKEQRGVYLSGIGNFARREAGPVHAAGIFNFAGTSLNGLQLAGIGNITIDSLKGLQFSGVLNVAPSYIQGAQVSGVLNVAKEVDGVQLGLINYTSRIKGVPIGLISIVGKGYHKIEISADELFYTNLAFRTGVREFYNILTVGAMPQTFDQDLTLWSFGYGIGTAPRISDKVFLNFDLTSSQIVMGQIEEINLLNKFYVGVDLQVAKSLSITAGITMNGHLTDVTYDKYPDIFTDYKPEIIYERDYSNNLNLKCWFGGKVGIRFL